MTEAGYIPTLEDLLTREKACRRSADFQPPSMAQLVTASNTQAGMVSYRLAPSWAWQGGPFAGLPLSDEDRMGALYNMAGALQPLLYLAAGLPAVAYATEGSKATDLSQWIHSPSAVMGGTLDEVADQSVWRESEDYGVVYAAPSELAMALNSLVVSGQGCDEFSLAAWLDDARKVLKFMGADLNALAAAYLMATNALLPPDPANAGSLQGEYMAVSAEDAGLN